MKSIRNLFFLAIVCFPFFVFAGDVGHFVGNGGEGILSQGKIYLRDLYEMGITENVYSGSSVDGEVDSVSAGVDLSRLSLAKEKLVLKLSDLQRVYPHLGVYVAETIKSYDWVFVDDQLAPVPDDAPIVSSLRRVTIANRYWSTIRIQRALWNDLPEDHKVALVIHEALFSLSRATCMDPLAGVDCSQSGPFVRDLVGKIFLRDLSLNPGFTEGFLRANLGLPKRFSDDFSCKINETSLQLSVMKKATQTAGPDKLNILAPILAQKESRDQEIQRYCESLHLDPATESLEIHLARVPYIKRMLYYIEDEGATQMEVSFLSRKGVLRDSEGDAVSTSAKCFSFLSQIADAWFDDPTSYPGRDSSCVARSTK